MIFFLYDYMSGLKKFKEQLPTKEKFYSPLTGKKLAIKSIRIFKVWDRFEMKAMKDYQDLHLKCDMFNSK